MTRVSTRVAAWLALALATGLLAHASSADATPPPPFVAVGHSPTQGTPVPGANLTADLGAWTSPPESYEFQWLRDGTPIAGATTRDYLVQVADIGHALAPKVTGHSGPDTADFVGTSMVARKIGSSIRLDVRRVHPAPTRHRLVWMAISFMTTERPWATDGGTVAAYRKKDGRLKELGRAVMTRGASFVRLPWKRAPGGGTPVMVCYLGSDVVEESCSPYAVVHRGS
ncbi:MAG: hypothetical protein QOD98_1120 [Nocardioidaceae bacterium]|nr:hypothetical protein [Nocardioidaceae bacterium]